MSVSTVKPAYSPRIYTENSVKLLLEGVKTQTRRVARPGTKAPVRAGDIDWVKESWKPLAWNTERTSLTLAYKADLKTVTVNPRGLLIDTSSLWARFNKELEINGNNPFNMEWRNPLFMPKGLTRIQLEIKYVYQENVQDITEEDAIAEGCVADDDKTAAQAYQQLWTKIHGRAHRWQDNPRVWVIEFEMLEEADA